MTFNEINAISNTATQLYLGGYTEETPEFHEAAGLLSNALTKSLGEDISIGTALFYLFLSYHSIHQADAALREHIELDKLTEGIEVAEDKDRDSEGQ